MSDSDSEEERIDRIVRNELHLDDPDEGFESAANTSDFEDIVVGRKHKLPRRPRFHVLSSSDEKAEEEAARGGRRLYDRYPRVVKRKRVSRGDDDNPGLALRNILRNTPTDGLGITNGDILEAKRVTGMGIRGGKIFYFVQWGEGRRDSYPMDEILMRWCYPELVIEFHEKWALSPTKYVVY